MQNYKKLIINTDGASRGNPGKASYGFVVKDDKGEIIYKEGKYIGIDTNNIAEYTAVFKALEYLTLNNKEVSNLEVEVVADSQLIIMQLLGKYKIKNERLFGIYLKIKNLESTFKNISYRHVLRAENKLADKMANLALDSL